MEIDSEAGTVALMPWTFPDGIPSTAMTHVKSRENAKRNNAFAKEKNR